MAASFATYASQFLTRNNNASLASSQNQPMFFSFTTDDSDDQHSRQKPNDEDDPHLHLDDDENSPFGFQESHLSQPRRSLLASELLRESDRGWLAHQNAGGSSSSSSSSASNSPTLPPPRTLQIPAESLTESLLPREPNAFAFSLPDPHSPYGRGRGRERYNDSIFTALFLGSVTICFVLCVVVLFTTTKQAGGRFAYKTLIKTVPLLTILTILAALVSYAHVWLLSLFVRPVMIVTSLLVPFSMFVCTIWAFVASFMWEDDGAEPSWSETTGLRLFALIPLTLTILSSRRLITGTLLREINTTSNILSLITRILLINPHLLLLSPGILLITLLGSIPFLTLIFRLVLLGIHTTGGGKGGTRLEYHLYNYSAWGIAFACGVWLWCFGVARGLLRVVSAGVVGAWYFNWQPSPTSRITSQPTPALERGIGGLINAYDTRAFHASIHRSTHGSLGSICIATLIRSIIRIISIVILLLAALLDNLPLYFPTLSIALTTRRGMWWVILKSIQTAINYLESVTSATSRYALLYTGLTGEGYWNATRRAAAFSTPSPSLARSATSHREAARALAALDRTLSTQTYTLSLPFALATYLFVAHLSSSPDAPSIGDGQALAAAILAGVVTSLVCGFCNGVVKDGAETIFLTWCIDRHMPPADNEGNDRERKDEVKRAFEYQPASERPVQPPAGQQPPRRRFSLPKRQSRTQQQRREDYPSHQIPYDDDEEPPTATAPLFVADSPVTARAPPSSPPPLHPQQPTRGLADPAPRSPPIASPPIVSPMHTEHQHVPQAVFADEEDVDPFEATLPDEEMIPSLSLSQHYTSNSRTGGGVGSGTLSSTVLKSKQQDEDDDDVFPGSGFF